MMDLRVIMQKHALALLVFAVLGATVVCVKVEDDGDLDPFDMVNFDHANMRMRKKILVNEKPVPEQPPLTQGQHEEQPDKQEFAKVKLTADKESGTEQKAEKSPPKADKSPSPTPAPKQEQKPEAEGSCPAWSLFQQFVSRLLRLVGDKVSMVDENASTDLCLQLRLTAYQVHMLESFKRDLGRDGVFNAHDILNEAMQGAYILHSDDPSIRHLWLEKHLGVTLDKALQVLSFVTYLVVLVVTLAVAFYKMRWMWMWILVSGFWVSVGMTWYRLYKSEVAKQHEALMKDMPAGCGSKPEGDYGLFSTMAGYVRSQFTFQQDACVDYYERLLTDPSVMVTPMEAFAVAMVQTLLKPLRTVGTEMSAFLRALVKDLPVQWQFVAVLMVCVFFALILLLSFGYRLRVPWLVSIEPSHSDKTLEMIALKEQIGALQATIARQPQVCDTVGSAPVENAGKARVTAPVERTVQETASDSTACQQCCLPLLTSQASLVQSSGGSCQSVQDRQSLRTNENQTVMFGEGENTNAPHDATITESAQREGNVERVPVSAELQSGHQCSVKGKSSTVRTADGCDPVPLVGEGCSSTGVESVGAVLNDVGQSGDADRAKINTSGH